MDALGVKGEFCLGELAGMVVELFGAQLVELELDGLGFGFECGEAGLEGGGCAVFFDGVGYVLKFLFVGGETGEQLTALTGLFGGETSRRFGLEAEHVTQVFGGEDDVGQLVEDGGFEGGAGDASLGAGSAFAVGEGAEVGLVFVAGFLVGGATVEGRSAVGAAGEAGEEEVGRLAARVVCAFAVFEIGGVFEVELDELDFVPEGFGDDRLAIVFVGFAAIFEDADEEFIFPEGGVGVDGAEKVGGFLDLV